jgi:hypothetical protein
MHVQLAAVVLALGLTASLVAIMADVNSSGHEQHQSVLLKYSQNDKTKDEVPPCLIPVHPSLATTKPGSQHCGHVLGIWIPLVLRTVQEKFEL